MLSYFNLSYMAPNKSIISNVIIRSYAFVSSKIWCAKFNFKFLAECNVCFFQMITFSFYNNCEILCAFRNHQNLLNHDLPPSGGAGNAF